MQMSKSGITYSFNANENIELSNKVKRKLKNKLFLLLTSIK